MRGDPYAEEREVDADLYGDTGVLGLWYPCRMCVFDVNVVDTDAASYYGRHPKKSCLKMSGKKRANVLRLYLRDDDTSRRLCSLWMGIWERRKIQQLRNWMPPCWKYGIGNNQKHAGMYRPIST